MAECRTTLKGQQTARAIFIERNTNWIERCHTIRSWGIENSSERVSCKIEIFECLWCNEVDTQN